MKRGEWHAGARLVHAQHPEMTHAEIGALFGVNRSAVYKVLHPDAAREYNARSDAQPGRHERKRAADRRWRATAEVRGACANPCCGNLRGIGGTLRTSEGMCSECVHAVAELRRTLAEGMWADGWTTGEMCAAYGVHKSYFSAQRARDWDMPHRRTPEQVARIRAGRWEQEELAA